MSEEQEKVTDDGQTDEIFYCRLDEPFCEGGMKEFTEQQDKTIEKML